MLFCYLTLPMIFGIIIIDFIYYNWLWSKGMVEVLKAGTPEPPTQKTVGKKKRYVAHGLPSASSKDYPFPGGNRKCTLGLLD